VITGEGNPFFPFRCVERTRRSIIAVKWGALDNLPRFLTRGVTYQTDQKHLFCWIVLLHRPKYITNFFS